MSGQNNNKAGFEPGFFTSDDQPDLACLIDGQVLLCFIHIHSLPEKHWRTVLTNAEQDRAARYHFKADCQRFVTGRFWLRQWLSQYQQQPPHKVLLTENAWGKLQLIDAADMHFNLSHSHEYVLLGFARHPLGVDIEHRRFLEDTDALARQILSDVEYRIWECWPAEQQELLFFDLWTMKEALIKGIGCGFSRSPATIHLPRLQHASMQLKDGQVLWQLYPCSLQPDYAATLAIQLPSQPHVSCLHMAGTAEINALTI